MMIYPNLEDKIRINFFSGPKKRNSKSNSQKPCSHLGTLAYNGFNSVEDGNPHRIKCLARGNRFGRDIEMWNLLSYQQKIKMILYELFDLKYPLTGVAKRWETPQEKLSRFN